MDNIYIKFKRATLENSLRLLSIFNKSGTLWCDGKKCEIVTTIDVNICLLVPFIETSIQSKFCCNITTELLTITLENNISDEIKLTFLTDKIIADAETKTPNISYFSIDKLTQRKSISSGFNNAKNNYVSPDYISDDSDTEETYDEEIKPLNQGNNLYIISTLTRDEYRVSSVDNNISYNIDLDDYKDIVFQFRLCYDTLASTIKKFTLSKASEIKIRIYKNQVTFTAFRANTLNKSDLSTCVFNNTLNSIKTVTLDLKYFSLLKKLSLSINNDNPRAKEKKIYKEIEFNGVRKDNKVAGFVIYPGVCNEDLASQLFIFIPVTTTNNY